MRSLKLLPAWSAKFKSAINWQRVHSLGYLIESTNDGLYGVNSERLARFFGRNKSYPALDPARFQEVEGTEFVTISFLTDKSSTIPMQAIIEVAGGKVLSRFVQKEQIGVLSRHVLPQIPKIARNRRTSEYLCRLPCSCTRLHPENNCGPTMISSKQRQAATKGFLESFRPRGQQLSNLTP